MYDYIIGLLILITYSPAKFLKTIEVYEQGLGFAGLKLFFSSVKQNRILQFFLLHNEFQKLSLEQGGGGRAERVLLGVDLSYPSLSKSIKAAEMKTNLASDAERSVGGRPPGVPAHM